jgi:hypothetical protein
MDLLCLLLGYYYYYYHNLHHVFSWSYDDNAFRWADSSSKELYRILKKLAATELIMKMSVYACLIRERIRKKIQFHTKRKDIYGVETLYILLLYGLRFGYLHLIFCET